MTMEYTSLPPSYKVPSATETLERRKVRKGTQSCWECKRRKVRCTFAPPRDVNVTCDRCKRRGTLCVSQEFPQNSTGQAVDRLGRVEAIVEQLVKSADTSGMQDLQGPLRSLTSNSPHLTGGVPTAPSYLEVPVPLGELGPETAVRVLLPLFHLYS